MGESSPPSSTPRVVARWQARAPSGNYGGDFPISQATAKVQDPCLDHSRPPRPAKNRIGNGRMCVTSPFG